MSYTQLDGPSLHGAISVSTTPVELKVGASALNERVVVSVLPTNGTVYWGFSNSVTASTGKPIFQNQDWAKECGTQAIWLVAASGTVDVRITEES